MKNLFFFLFSLAPFLASSQDLTGIWRGHFQSNNTNVIDRIYGIEDRYKFEIQLDQRNKLFHGVTYSYKTTVFYGKADCQVQVNDNTKKVLLEELKIVEVRMSEGSDACIMTLFLNYSKNGDDEFMEGTYTSMNTRDSSSCGRGTVFLRKVTTTDFYKEPFLVKREEEDLKKKNDLPKLNTPPNNTSSANKTAKTSNRCKKYHSTNKTTTNKTTTTKTGSPSTAKKSNTVTSPEKDIVSTNPSKAIIAPARTDTVKQIERKINPNISTPRVLANRQNELVKTITVNTSEVVVDIYDNGTIDNDTVSVYLDKKLVISKQRLTDQPITFKFKLDDDNDYHELVMVAENLGDIPPNTSLMIVKAGDKRFEVRITSTEQKNAVVIFKYEKPN
jgi:hypothetical protein